MDLRFKVYHSLADLPATWDEKLPESHALHSSKIGVTELAHTSDIINYYVEGFCPQNQLVFQAYCQQLSIRSKHFNLAGNGIKKWLIQNTIDLIKPKMLVAGNLFRHDVHMLHFHKRSLSRLDRSKILEDAIDYMVTYSKSHGAFIKDVPHEIATYFINKKEYQRMENDISMRLAIPASWQSFDDYQNELKRKYKNRAKKTRAEFKGIIPRILNLEEIRTAKKEMHALYKQVTHNQVVSMGELGEDYIAELKKSLGDQYQVTGFFLPAATTHDKDKMIAFSSAIIHDGVHDMNYIGFDYAYNQQYSLYFNLLFNCVECAIGNRCHQLLLGRTALEAKAIIGCEPDYLFTFYRLKSTVLNALVQNISKRFETRLGEGWENRHPFRASYYEHK